MRGQESRDHESGSGVKPESLAAGPLGTATRYTRRLTTWPREIEKMRRDGPRGQVTGVRDGTEKSTP